MSADIGKGNGASPTEPTDVLKDSGQTSGSNGGGSQSGDGKLIVITAPLTEAIDHAGYFIQMAMASLPIWLEWILDKKYPEWRNVEYNTDGSAKYMPAGVGVLEKSLLRKFSTDDVVACYPDDLTKFIGSRTRVVAVSTHNPLGVTFAAGVYTSIFGSSKMPINSHYTRLMFDTIKSSEYRGNFKVIVGGSGGWQIKQTDTYDELGVDCVVDGRSESVDSMALFHKAIRGEDLDREITVEHPRSREAVLFPDRRTSFGVIEMTTGCGRRCNFCVPDLNPQLDLPKDKIMSAVRANIENGNGQISLATEDMFIWGQVQTDTPFLLPEPGGVGRSLQGILQLSGRQRVWSVTLDDSPSRRRSRTDRAAFGHNPRQEPHPFANSEQASEEESAHTADRPGNRVGPAGKEDHAE